MSPLFQIALALALAFIFVFITINLMSAQGLTDLSRITTASPAGRGSRYPSISADGSIIVFHGNSGFLGETILFGQSEIWLYNTDTMTFTRITEASDPSYRDSFYPSVSADGTRIAFQSDSDFLGEGLPDQQYEIWLFDTQTMTYTRVTTASDNDRVSEQPCISPDGSAIAFSSDSDFLGEGIPSEQQEIWLYDVGTQVLTRVTTASDSNRTSSYPSLNADGTIVAFESDSDFLGQGLSAEHQEIWIYDTGTMTYTRVTTSAGGREGYHPSLSADGTLVAFTHDGDLLGQGIPDNQFEIWLYDTDTMVTTRVTTSSGSERASDNASISADGSKVAFQSDSDFLNEGIPDNQFEVWLYETDTMTLTRITQASDTNRDSLQPSLSENGLALAFHSDSDFLGDGIPDGQDEVWLANFGYTIYLPFVMR